MAEMELDMIRVRRVWRVLPRPAARGPRRAGGSRAVTMPSTDPRTRGRSPDSPAATCSTTPGRVRRGALAHRGDRRPAWWSSASRRRCRRIRSRAGHAWRATLAPRLADHRASRCTGASAASALRATHAASSGTGGRCGGCGSSTAGHVARAGRGLPGLLRGGFRHPSLQHADPRAPRLPASAGEH